MAKHSLQDADDEMNTKAQFVQKWMKEDECVEMGEFNDLWEDELEEEWEAEILLKATRKTKTKVILSELEFRWWTEMRNIGDNSEVYLLSKPWIDKYQVLTPDLSTYYMLYYTSKAFKTVHPSIINSATSALSRLIESTHMSPPWLHDSIQSKVSSQQVMSSEYAQIPSETFSYPPTFIPY